MREIFIESNRSAYLEYFNIEERQYQIKRILLGLLFMVIGLIATYFIGNVFLYGAIPVIAFVGYKLPYYNLVRDKKHSDLVKSFIFPQFLRYFIALLGSQGNVYKTLVTTAGYLDDPLQSKLLELIKKIEVDNDYQHYRDFAEYIGTPESQMVMGMIYNFSEHGIMPEELYELERMIERLNENKTEQMVAFKTDEQEKYMNPPIFTAIFFIMSFVGVVLWYNLANAMSYLG